MTTTTAKPKNSCCNPITLAGRGAARTAVALNSATPAMTTTAAVGTASSVQATATASTANAWASRVQALFQYDADLTAYWNTVFASGKWIHLMDQVHIGYTSWNDPPSNIMPAVTTYAAPVAADLGVAVEGSATALAPGAKTVLPGLHSEGGAATRYVDLFRRGTVGHPEQDVRDVVFDGGGRRLPALGREERIDVGLADLDLRVDLAFA